MDFVEGGVACRNGEGDESPRPAPTLAFGAHSAEKKKIKNEVLREVCGFANDIVYGLQLMTGEGRKQPVDDWHKDRSGVVGREGVRRKSKDDASPDERRPPRAEPVGNESRSRDAAAEFFEFGSWARITPGLF